MNVKALILTAAALAAPAALLTAPAAGQDTFENGANPSGWTFDTFVADTLPLTGGNPGGWLRNDAMATIPHAICDPLINSPFNGDYRSMGVTRITIDAITEVAGFGSGGAGGRNFSMRLVDTHGTNDITDDDYATFVGALVPQVGLGWVSYVFDIPSASTTLPAGWSGGYFGDPLNFRPGYDWNEMMQHVDTVEFYWADPASFGIFQAWDVGIDNVNIEAAGFGTSYCGPAVANSTGAPGIIFATGSTQAALNSLVLRAESLPNNAFGFFLTSQTQGFVMNPGGSTGHLCLGGAVGRYVGPGQILNTGTTGEISLTLDLAQTPTPTGLVAIQAGETWNFQAWHRDAVGGVATSNFTDALSLTFN